MGRKKTLTVSSKCPETGSLFVQGLLEWNSSSNKREMPWKGEKDPYRIWLSEIILQQTRVEQGLKYYQNFITAFPDVHALANAPEEKVFKAWEGLGYYSRCRNLIRAAQFISSELKGIFPADYESILNLNGVGPYTAAAIASFAYNLPYAVLDGNVFRVLSRIFDDATAIDSTEGKKIFSQRAQELLPHGKAGIYNQAIMDFGATICKPVPLCMDCFFSSHCKAFQNSTQQMLPVKEKKIKIRQRWFNYIIIEFKDEIAVRKRITNDIWSQLFEFLLIETNEKTEISLVLSQMEKQVRGITYHLISSHDFKQKLTHQTIEFNLVHIQVNKKPGLPGYSWINKNELAHLAFPKALQSAIAAICK